MLVSANATGTETVSLASAAMSVDSGPESEFDFGDMDAEPTTGRKGRSKPGASNILVSLQTEQAQKRPVPKAVP